MTKRVESSVVLLDAPAYVSDLCDKISRAKLRVILFTHIIAYDSSTERLVLELEKAAARGVTVELAGDVYTFGILKGYFRNKQILGLRKMIKQLRAKGVNYRWIGTFGPFLFAGRTHVKWCIVDNTVYSFGGVNLYKKGIDSTDYMLRLTDKKLADFLENEHFKIARADRLGQLFRSHDFFISTGTVIIDGGVVFDSKIYHRACQLARRAESIVFVSQYCPTGKLGKILSQKISQLYFNPWQLADGGNRLLIRRSMAKTGYQTKYVRSVYNHSKFIIFTMVDGSKIAITGSHNFVYGGVVLGTREIALETSDQSIIDQLETFVKEHIAGPDPEK